MNIVVSPEDDVEIRRIRLRNDSSVCRSLEVTSYIEVALAPPVDDASHPALSKIFVETEIDRANNAIFCTRRARLQVQSPSCFHVMQVYGGGNGEAGASAVGGTGASATGGAAAGASFETDRLGFIGRGHTLGQPKAVIMGGELANRAGSVVDPVMVIRYSVTLGPGEEIIIDLLLGVGEDRVACGSLIQKYRDRSRVDYVFHLAVEHTRAICKRLKVNEPDIQLFARLAGFVLFANDQWPAGPETKVRNRLGQSSLWSYSLSGDLPIVLLRIDSLQQIEVATACDRVTAHNFRALRRLRDVPKRRDVRQCAPPCRRCERWLQRAESRRSDRSCGGDTCRIDRGGETSACGPRRLTRRPPVFALCSPDGCRQCLSPRTARRHPCQSAARADRLLSGRRLPGAPVQRRAHLCRRRACDILRSGQHRGSRTLRQLA